MKNIILKFTMLFLLAFMVIPVVACSKEIVYYVDKRDDSPSSEQSGTKTTTAKPTQTTEEGNGDGSAFNITVWCAEEDHEMILSMLQSYEEKYSSNTYNWKIENQGEDIVSATVIRDVDAAADVFSFANDQIGTLMSAQALLQIPTAYQAQIEEQIDVAQQAAKYNNANYAIPYSYENCFLYYNKSKISNVSTLEGILQASIPGVDYNLGIDMSDSYYTTMFLYTAGVKIFGDNGNDPTDINLDNAEAYKACKYIAGLASQTKLGSIAKADQFAAFRNGKVAAMISGPHMISQFKDALGTNFGVAMLPKIRFQGESSDTQLVSFSGVKMYGISNKPNRDQKLTNEAVKVAAYLANQENQQIRLEEREFCPTNSDLFDEAINSGIDTVEVVVNQSEYSKLKPGIIQMSNYWDNMKNFLLGVYKLTYAESSWSTELKKIESKLKS